MKTSIRHKILNYAYVDKHYLNEKKRIHINVIQLADLWFAVSTTTRESCRKKWVASIM